MKKMNIVFKIIFPLFIGLLLIAGVSIYTNFYLLEKNIVKKSNETFNSVSKIFKNIVQQDTNIMLDLIDQVAEDPTVIKLYNEREREKLFNYLQKRYISYNKRHDITHFYVHNLDKANFLRVHNKNVHSDTIDRITLKNAALTLQASSGIEFGIVHNLTLRVVSPWYVNDKLIGFIELGKEIDKVTPELTNLIDVDFIFTVKKNLISKEDFEKWKNKSDRNRHYESMKNYYIIDSTIDKIGSDLKKHLDMKGKHENHYLENNEKKYFINTRSFFDMKKQHVGYIHTVVDVTEDYKFLYSLIMKVSFVVFLLLFCMLVYYIQYLQKQESKLKDAYSKIQKLSITDGLTGVFNKRHYLENGPRQINVCSRCNGYISFILIDVDNFKKYNDIYGHLEGDKALVKISQAMRKVFKRSSDCSYRVGGEEFLIISKSDHENNNLHMAEKLRKSIMELNIKHKENESYEVLTVSIGICTTKAINTTQLDDLYRKADDALYRSKNNGRNQVTLS